MLGNWVDKALLTHVYKQDAVLGQSTTQVNGHV